ncbi:MAG: hypothetical protein JWN76_1613 [Chitinophagaceae bacterium]|nr:hypothetical protein [Chitinophagaceae bacterium]
MKAKKNQVTVIGKKLPAVIYYTYFHFTAVCFIR